MRGELVEPARERELLPGIFQEEVLHTFQAVSPSTPTLAGS